MVCLKTVVVPVVLAGEVVDVKYVDKKRYASIRPEDEVEEERRRRFARRLERIELRAQKHAERVSPNKRGGRVPRDRSTCHMTWREVRSAHFAEHGPYAPRSWGFKCSDGELELCYQEWKQKSQRQTNLVPRRFEGHAMVRHSAPVLTFRRNRQTQVTLEDHIRCRFAGLRIDDAMLSKHDSKFVDREVARLKRSYKARQDRPTVEMVLKSIKHERVVAAKSARAARKALAHLRAARRQRQLEALAFFLGTTTEHVSSYTQCTNVYDYKREHGIKLTYEQCRLARYLKLDYTAFQNDERLSAIKSVKQYKVEKTAQIRQVLKVKNEQTALNEWQKRAFGLMKGRFNPGAIKALALSCDEELKFTQLKVYLKRCVPIQGGIGLDSGNSTLTPEHVLFGTLGDRRDVLVGGLEDVKSLKKGFLDRFAPYVDTAHLGPGCSGLFMIKGRTKGNNVAWHDGRCIVSGKAGDGITNAIIGTRPHEAWSHAGIKSCLPLAMLLLTLIFGAHAVVPEYSREVREWSTWVKTLYNETTNTITINSNIGQVRAHATQIANLREDLRRIIKGRGSPAMNSSLSTIDAAGMMLKFLDRQLEQAREIANAHKDFVQRLLSLMEEVRKVMASLGTLQSETYYLLKMYDDLVTQIYNMNTFSMSLVDENRTSVEGLIEIMKEDLVFIRNNVNEQTANVQRVKRTLRFDVENSITKENVGVVSAVVALNLVSNFKLVVPSILFFIILFLGNFQASASIILKPVSVNEITLVDGLHCISDYCSTDKLSVIKAVHEMNKCFFMDAREYEVENGVIKCQLNVRRKREISKQIDNIEKTFNEYKNNYTEKAKAYWQDVKDSKVYKAFETMTDGNKLILCIIVLVAAYFFLGTLATATIGVVALSVLSFDSYVSSETLVILFWIIVVGGSFIFFGPHAAFIVIVFWAINRHTAQAAHCSDRLMHTMVGMRYRSNNEVLNVTGGFIPLTVGHCYYWKVSVNGENITKSLMLKNITVAQESWQTIFSTPEHFEQIGCMDWVCSETLNRHCERDLKSAVAKMDITHVWQDIATEMYGFWRCGCAGTCYKESWVGIGINNSTMCEYQSRNTVDSYKLVLVLDDSKQVTTVNFRQKINTWFDVLGGKFKIITPIGEMAPRFRLVCGHKTYYMNDKLSIPHDVLKMDRVGTIDWAFFEKLVRYEYYAATDTSKFDLKLISIFESLPSNFWTDKDYHFQFEIVELEAKIEDVVFELDDCNVTHVTRSGEVSRAMSQLVSVKVKVFSTNSPCKLQVSNDDELCMPISSSFYSVFKKIDIIDIVDFAASDCVTHFVVADKNLTNVRVPAMSAWSYVGYYQHKLMGIVGYDDGGWFNFKFDLGNFIDNRVVQSCIALIILYFVFLSNPIMAVVVMIFGVMIWQVKGDGMEGSSSIEDLFVRIACGMLFFFLYNQISKLRMRRLSYDPIVYSVFKMHTIIAEVGQMIDSAWVLFSVVVLRFSTFWGFYCFVYGLVKKYKFVTCSFKGFVLIDEGDLNLFIWHFLNFPNVFLFNCLLNGFDGNFTALVLFGCTFCKLYRIHLFAWDYVLSLHCLIKYDFSKVDDILVTDLNLLRNFEGNQVEQLDKCCQVTDYDLACPYHNGLSATFENGKYINDSRIIENHWYCGWSKLVGKRVKNVIVDTQVSCKYLRELEDSTHTADDAEVRRVFQMLQSVISTKEHGLMCGIKVEYGIIEKAAVTVGHEDFFAKARINQVHIPVIYRIVCGNRSGFAFMHKGAVYSSYHVTRGKAIVLPEVKRDGMSEKQVYLPVSVDKQLDYCVYGISNQLDEIKLGKWYVVINPEQQQSILLKAEQDRQSLGGEGVILMKRYVVTKENELLVYNVFGKFGWSGLPIISLDSSEVVGIYGKMIANADNTGASVQLPLSMGNIVPTNWDKIAEEILACGNRQSVKTVNTPTASGKSTLFPLALAKNLYHRKHHGLIVVLNPLRAVPVALSEYVRGLLKSAKLLDQIVVHYSIGKEESYTMDSELNHPGKVVIVYMTYGKYMTRRSHLNADVILADEVHCQQPEVTGTIDCVSKRVKDGKECFKFVLMTATPKNQAIADRQIAEEAQNIKKDQVKSHHVKIDENFYFDTQYLSNKTKHLIFVPSRKACIDVQVQLKAKKFSNIYNFYSKHENGFENIERFNRADTAVIISTNAIESGITLIGLTHVWDSRLEFKPKVSGNRVILERRVIDKISVTQRRGRVGRTGELGFYIYPEVRSDISDEHNDVALLERQVAAYFKWLSISRNDMEDAMWQRIVMIENLWKEVTKGDDFWELLVNSKIDAITLRTLCKFDPSKDSAKWLINPEVSRVAWQDYIKECSDGEMTVERYFNLQSDQEYDRTIHFALAEKEEDNNLQLIASTCAVFGCTLVLAEMVATLRGFCYVEEMYLVFDKDWRSFGAYGYYDFIFGYDKEVVVGSLLSNTDQKDTQAFWARTNMPERYQSSLQKSKPYQYIVRTQLATAGFFLIIDPSGVLKIIADNTLEGSNTLNVNYVVNTTYLEGLRQYFVGMQSNFTVIEENNATMVTPEQAITAVKNFAGPVYIAAMSFAPGGVWLAGGVGVAWDLLVSKLGTYNAIVVATICSSLFISPVISITSVVAANFTYLIKRILFGACLDEASRAIPATPVALTSSLLFSTALNYMYNVVPAPSQANWSLTGAMLPTSKGSMVLACKHLLNMAKNLRVKIRDRSQGHYVSIGRDFLLLFGELKQLSVFEISVIIVAAALYGIIISNTNMTNRVVNYLVRRDVKDRGSADEVLGTEGLSPDDVLMLCLSVAGVIVSPTSTVSVILGSLYEMYCNNVSGTGKDTFNIWRDQFIDKAGVPIWICCVQVVGEFLLKFRASDVPAGGENDSMLVGASIASVLVGGGNLLLNFVQSFNAEDNSKLGTLVEVVKAWFIKCISSIVGLVNMVWAKIKNMFKTEEQILKDTKGIWSRDLMMAYDVRFEYMLLTWGLSEDLIRTSNLAFRLKSYVAAKSNRGATFINSLLRQIPKDVVYKVMCVDYFHEGMNSFNIGDLSIVLAKNLNYTPTIDVSNTFSGICYDPAFAYCSYIMEGKLIVVVATVHPGTGVKLFLMLDFYPRHISATIFLGDNLDIPNDCVENFLDETRRVVSHVVGSNIPECRTHERGHDETIRHFLYLFKESEKSTVWRTIGHCKTLSDMYFRSLKKPEEKYKIFTDAWLATKECPDEEYVRFEPKNTTEVMQRCHSRTRCFPADLVFHCSHDCGKMLTEMGQMVVRNYGCENCFKHFFQFPEFQETTCGEQPGTLDERQRKIDEFIMQHQNESLHLAVDEGDESVIAFLQECNTTINELEMICLERATEIMNRCLEFKNWLSVLNISNYWKTSVCAQVLLEFGNVKSGFSFYFVKNYIIEGKIFFVEPGIYKQQYYLLLEKIVYRLKSFYARLNFNSQSILTMQVPLEETLRDIRACLKRIEDPCCCKWVWGCVAKLQMCHFCHEGCTSKDHEEPFKTLDVSLPHVNTNVRGYVRDTAKGVNKVAEATEEAKFCAMLKQRVASDDVTNQDITATVAGVEDSAPAVEKEQAEFYSEPRTLHKIQKTYLSAIQAKFQQVKDEYFPSEDNSSSGSELDNTELNALETKGIFRTALDMILGIKTPAEMHHLGKEFIKPVDRDNKPPVHVNWNFFRGVPHHHNFQPSRMDQSVECSYSFSNFNFDKTHLISKPRNEYSGIHKYKALPGEEDNDIYYQFSDADKFFEVFNVYDFGEEEITFKNIVNNKVVFCDTPDLNNIINRFETSTITTPYPTAVHKTSFWATEADVTQSYDLQIHTKSPYKLRKVSHTGNETVVVGFSPDDVEEVYNLSKHFLKVGLFFPNCTKNSDFYAIALFRNFSEKEIPNNFRSMYMSVLRKTMSYRKRCCLGDMSKLPSHIYPRPGRSLTWAPLTHGTKLEQSKREADLLKWAFSEHRVPQFLQVDATTARHRTDRCDRNMTAFRLKRAPVEPIQAHFQHQKVLAAYHKSDRLPQDRNTLSYTTSNISRKVLNWHPINSVVVQVSKEKSKVFESIQTRLDQPVSYIHQEVMDELYECAASMKITNLDNLEPMTYQQLKDACLINKKGAAGIFEGIENMQTLLDDPNTEHRVHEIIRKLKNRETCDDYVANIHHKVESKVSSRAENGLLVDNDPDLINVKPRLITYFDAIARIVDWMVFGPYNTHHMSKEKLYPGSNSGMPITEVGDVMKKAWDSFEDPRGATGDASKFDHTVGVDLMNLERQWVKSHYKREWWPVIDTIYDHWTWPVAFTRLGFVMTMTGHRLSGCILTWHNGFLSALMHMRAWKKVLKMPMSTPCDKVFEKVFSRYDGDDQYHIGNSDVVNEGNMKKVEYFVNQCCIKIRSGTHSGYAIHEDLTTVDFLSHTYQPVSVKGKEKWLPVRPISEILGKLSFTMKIAATRNTAKYSKIQSLVEDEKFIDNRSNLGHEGILVESSKALSYLIQYPHIPLVRSMALCIFSVLGAPGDMKHMRTWRIRNKLGHIPIDVNSPVTVNSAINSVYGCDLHEIGLVDADWYFSSLRDHLENVRFASVHWPQYNKHLNLAYNDSLLNSGEEQFRRRLSHHALARRMIVMTEEVAHTGGFQDLPYPEYFGLWGVMSRAYFRMHAKYFRQVKSEETVEDVFADINIKDIFNNQIVGKIKSSLNFLLDVITKPVGPTTIKEQPSKRNRRRRRVQLNCQGPVVASPEIEPVDQNVLITSLLLVLTFLLVCFRGAFEKIYQKFCRLCIILLNFLFSRRVLENRFFFLFITSIVLFNFKFFILNAIGLYWLAMLYQTPILFLQDTVNRFTNFRRAVQPFFLGLVHNFEILRARMEEYFELRGFNGQ